MNHNTNRGETKVSYLAELAKMDTTCITPKQAAKALGCTAFYIGKMAKDEDQRANLGFPVILIGTRTKIPRLPFLKALGWEVEA